MLENTARNPTVGKNWLLCRPKSMPKRRKVRWGALKIDHQIGLSRNRGLPIYLMRVSSISPCIPSVFCRNPWKNPSVPLFYHFSADFYLMKSPGGRPPLNSPGNCDTGSSRLTWISPSKSWQFSGSVTDIVQWRDGTKEPLKQQMDVLKKKGPKKATESWVLPTRNWDQSQQRMLIEPENAWWFLAHKRFFQKAIPKRLNIPESNRRTGAGCRSFLRSEFLEVGILEVSENREPKSVMA